MTPRTPITGEEVADVLERAADLIAKPGAWTTGAEARNSFGYVVDTDSDEAVCFCAGGAIWAVARHPINSKALRAIEAKVGGDVPHWNDAPERTQAEVVAALRSAATAARQQGEA